MEPHVHLSTCRRSSLQFELNGADLTCQEMKLTQQRIDEVM